ncbi:MAG TPA: flagellar hook protein FlgE [Longimicrobiaceae bacterium]
MMRSLLSAVSGMRNHQVRMDVIGNNVANVNTTAYKASRATFKESFSQLVQSAGMPTNDSGGTNPKQIGTGVELGSVDTIFTQGNFDATGVRTDLMVQGDAFFVVAQGNQRLFTRAGNFQIDADGYLVHPTNGYRLQGRMAVDGVLQGGVTDVRIPFGLRSPARATTEFAIGGNLDATADPNTTVSSSITVYDSLGERHEVEITFTKTANPNEWTYTISSATATVDANGSGTLLFNNDGTLDVAGSTIPEPLQLTPNSGQADQLQINLVEGDGSMTSLTQMRGPSSPLLHSQDGYSMGDLIDYSIDERGVVTGTFTNGHSLTLAQIALADFNNPAGLMRMGDNMYSTSPNSGDAQVSFAGEGSQSSISSGGLEMSNVDLAQEFTRMIVTQRGFQAAGRVITSADEMLQEVVNLKR